MRVVKVSPGNIAPVWTALEHIDQVTVIFTEWNVQMMDLFRSLSTMPTLASEKQIYSAVQANEILKIGFTLETFRSMGLGAKHALGCRFVLWKLDDGTPCYFVFRESCDDETLTRLGTACPKSRHGSKIHIPSVHVSRAYDQFCTKNRQRELEAKMREIEELSDAVTKLTKSIHSRLELLERKPVTKTPSKLIGFIGDVLSAAIAVTIAVVLLP